MVSSSSTAEHVSSMSIDDLKKMRNLINSKARAFLQPLTQALDSLDPSNCSSEQGSGQKSSQKSIEFRKNGNDLYVKKKHNKTDHKMILYFYNKSVAYAPTYSEELALAFSNRSALWLHLQRHDLCLTDVERAMRITRCDDLRKKLSTRQENCLQLQQRVKKHSKKLKLPEIQASKSFTCAAGSIALSYNDKYGRHYTASRNIRPGEIVMIEHSPFISVKNNHLYFVCSHCLAFVWAGIPCDSCVFAIYCSEVCKKEAWQHYHDTMCSKIPIIQSFFDRRGTQSDGIVQMHGMMLMVTRIIDIFIKKEGMKAILQEADKIDKDESSSSEKLKLDEFNCNSFRSIYKLSNCKMTNRMESTSVSTIRDKLTYIVNTNAYGFVAVPLADANNQIPCSCKDFQTCIKNNCSYRGEIVGPCSSLINHSCIPNVVQLFLPGPKIILITISPVKKGEQLFNCYGPIACATFKKVRQDDLRGRYFFNCQCIACRQNLPDSRTSEALTAAEQEMMNLRLRKMFGKHAGMLDGPAENWHYREDILKASIEMCEFLHDRLDIWKAALFSQKYQYYIQKCFLYLYSENAIEFPSAC